MITIEFFETNIHANWINYFDEISLSSLLEIIRVRNENW